LPEGNVTGTLWVLLLSTVMFLASFVMVNALFPGYLQTGQAYRQLYESYVTGRETLRGTDFDVFNQTANQTMTSSLSLTYVKITLIKGIDIRGFYHYFSGSQEKSMFSFIHVTNTWPFTDIPLISHLLVKQDGKNNILRSDILSVYDNSTGGSLVKISCEHISIDLVFRPNDTSETLPTALDNGDPINLSFSYQIDFASMGANIWTVLANVLLFQTIKTGQSILDYMLNALVSIPIYTSIGYIIYRIVAGLIPTASGGGGQ
jgi:hypothetical protein